MAAIVTIIVTLGGLLTCVLTVIKLCLEIKNLREKTAKQDKGASDGKPSTSRIKAGTALVWFSTGLAVTSFAALVASLSTTPPFFSANKMEDSGLPLSGGDSLVKVTFSSFSQHIFSIEDAAFFTVPYQGTYVVSIFFVRSPPLLDPNNDGGGNCYVEILHGQDIKSGQEIALVSAYRSGQKASTSASLTGPVFLKKNEKIWCEAKSEGGAAILKNIQFSAVSVSAYQIPLTSPAARVER